MIKLKHCMLVAAMLAATHRKADEVVGRMRPTHFREAWEYTVEKLAVNAVMAGARPGAALVEVVPGLAIAFQVEPLGMLFALVASALWIVNSIYSIGYMRAHDEPRQTSFYVCFAIALGSTMGIAFAANLFTLFLFYEALTLCTFPLVTHKQNAEAMRAGRLYLLLLLGTSMVLLLPAIIATWFIAGTIDFAPGGILANKASPLTIGILLALYAFGIGKAALMPVHFWLPAAMVAPATVDRSSCASAENVRPRAFSVYANRRSLDARGRFSRAGRLRMSTPDARPRRSSVSGASVRTVPAAVAPTKRRWWASTCSGWTAPGSAAPWSGKPTAAGSSGA